MTLKFLTESEFAELNKLLLEEAAEAEAEKAAKSKKEARRARLLEMLVPLATEKPTVAPGVQVKTITDVDFDDAVALEFAKRPDILPAAASILSIKPEMIGLVIAQAMTNPNLINAFRINPTGYAAAARNGMFNDMPVKGVTETKQLSISTGALKTGDALRAEFNVVPDEAV